MWLAEKGGDIYHHPYDLGVYENLISVRTIYTAILWFYECCTMHIFNFKCKMRIAQYFTKK